MANIASDYHAICLGGTVQLLRVTMVIANLEQQLPLVGVNSMLNYVLMLTPLFSGNSLGLSMDGATFAGCLS